MEEITQGIYHAVNLILSGDNKLYEILYLSLKVSLSAVFLGVLVGIPMGALLGLNSFPGKNIFTNIIYTLMGLPPVVAGLVVYLFLSRSGPLGSFELLFTPTAMIIAQFFLVTPILIGLTMAAIEGKDKLISETARTLGATKIQTAWTIIREARGALLAATITGLGRALAEVGAVMLVGGNILHQTRVMTTSIVMETRQGNFDIALALGIILIIIAFIINGLLQIISRKLGVVNERTNTYS